MKTVVWRGGPLLLAMGAGMATASFAELYLGSSAPMLLASVVVGAGFGLTVARA